MRSVEGGPGPGAVRAGATGGRQPSRRAVVAASAVAAALVHVTLLSWDRGPDVDPVTGRSSGPYDTWQIACATVTLGIIAWCGGRALHPWAAAAALSVALTTAWSVGAATASDEDADLWPIGATLLLLGSFMGTLPVALLAQRWSRARHRTTGPGLPPT